MQPSAHSSIVRSRSAPQNSDALLCSLVQANHVSAITDYLSLDIETKAVKSYLTWRARSSQSADAIRVLFTGETVALEELRCFDVHFVASSSGVYEAEVDWKGLGLKDVLVRQKWCRVGAFAIPRSLLKSALQRHLTGSDASKKLPKCTPQLLRSCERLRPGQLGMRSAVNERTGNLETGAPIPVELHWLLSKNRVRFLPGTGAHVQLLILGYDQRNLISKLQSWFRSDEYLVPPHIYHEHRRMWLSNTDWLVPKSADGPPAKREVSPGGPSGQQGSRKRIC